MIYRDFIPMKYRMQQCKINKQKYVIDMEIIHACSCSLYVRKFHFKLSIILTLFKKNVNFL